MGSYVYLTGYVVMTQLLRRLSGSMQAASSTLLSIPAQVMLLAPAAHSGVKTR